MCTWFNDVLVRFGYDLFEYEHPWQGEWLDDAFEVAAKDLRSTGAKLLRALERVSGDDPETGPLTVDLVVTYVGRVLDGLAVAIPNCFGVEGRSMPRGSLAALGFEPPVTLSFPTQTDELYLVVDAGDRTALASAHERVRAQSRAVTREAIARLDAALTVLCPWFDEVLVRLQREIAARADDGDELLTRWADPNWSVIGRATPALTARLPRCA